MNYDDEYAATEAACVRAVAAAAYCRGDADDAVITECLAQIVHAGADHVHAALCTWTALSAQWVYDGDMPEGALWSVGTLNAETGEVKSLDELDAPQEVRDAYRFISLLKNGDHATIAAIILAYWQEDEGPEPIARLMSAVLSMATHAAIHLFVDDQQRQAEAN